MSSALHFSRLARIVVAGAAGLASAGVSLWLPTPSLARSAARAAAQDPYGQDPIPDPGLYPGDDGMPLPGNRRRTKPARKKGNTADKSKKSEPTGKDKSSAKKSSKGDDSGKLKFSQDIAPILVANCTGCHSGDGVGLKKSKLDLSTFEKLQAGAGDHKVVLPGKPDESNLVLRIKGEIEPRMPQGANTTLAAEAIAKIERWVKEGAKLDSGNDPKKLISSYAASPEQVRRAEVARLPVGERDKKTEEVGLQRYKQANAALKPDIVRTDHFMMFSGLPKERANNTLKILETQYNHLKRILGNAGTEWPEKVSVYAFSNHKDYIEFIRTVEGRADVDGEEAASARFSVPQPYVAVIDPSGGKSDEPGAGGAGKRKARSSGRRGEEKATTERLGSTDRTLQGIITESLGAGVVTAAGNPPRWLAYGIGTYLSAQVEPRSPYYKQLRQTAFANFQQGWPTRANEALGGSDQLTPDGLHSIGFALVETMMSTEMKPSFSAFARGMLGGTEKLDDMLQQVFRASREEFINYSGEWVAQRYGHLQ